MQFVVMDLEWNGAYCRQTHGYFNEIIEIGAVRLDEKLQPSGEFHAVIRPQLQEWLHSRDAVILTWSTTDLLVMMENCRYYYEDDRLPFMERYADLQVYSQQRMGVGTAQQIALGKACELLGIDEDGADLHRALDDSRLSARILQRIYEADSFAENQHHQRYRQSSYQTQCAAVPLPFLQSQYAANRGMAVSQPRFLRGFSLPRLRQNLQRPCSVQVEI